MTLPTPDTTTKSVSLPDTYDASWANELSHPQIALEDVRRNRHNYALVPYPELRKLKELADQRQGALDELVGAVNTELARQKNLADVENQLKIDELTKESTILKETMEREYRQGTETTVRRSRIVRGGATVALTAVAAATAATGLWVFVAPAATTAAVFARRAARSQRAINRLAKGESIEDVTKDLTKSHLGGESFLIAATSLGAVVGVDVLNSVDPTTLGNVLVEGGVVVATGGAMFGAMIDQAEIDVQTEDNTDALRTSRQKLGDLTQTVTNLRNGIDSNVLYSGWDPAIEGFVKTTREGLPNAFPEYDRFIEAHLTYSQQLVGIGESVSGPRNEGRSYPLPKLVLDKLGKAWNLKDPDFTRWCQGIVVLALTQLTTDRNARSALRAKITDVRKALLPEKFEAVSSRREPQPIPRLSEPYKDAEPVIQINVNDFASDRFARQMSIGFSTDYVNEDRVITRRTVVLPALV